MKMKEKLFWALTVAVLVGVSWGWYEFYQERFDGPAFSNDIFNHWVLDPDAKGKGMVFVSGETSTVCHPELEIFFIKRWRKFDMYLHPDPTTTERKAGSWSVHDKDHMDITVGSDTWRVEILSVDKDRLVIGRHWIPSDDE